MSCVLRAWGKDFDALKFSKRTSFKKFSLRERGKPLFTSNPDGPVHSESGIQIATSEAPFERLDLQIKDTITFLKKYGPEIKRLGRMPGLKQFKIDFGIDKREAIGQFDYFPAELLKLAGNLGLGLELSQYSYDKKVKAFKTDLFRLKESLKQTLKAERAVRKRK